MIANKQPQRDEAQLRLVEEAKERKARKAAAEKTKSAFPGVRLVTKPPVVVKEEAKSNPFKLEARTQQKKNNPFATMEDEVVAEEDDKDVSSNPFSAVVDNSSNPFASAEPSGNPFAASTKPTAHNPFAVVEENHATKEEEEEEEEELSLIHI